MKQTLSTSQRFAASLALSLGMLVILPFYLENLENLDRARYALYLPIFLLIGCTANYELRKQKKSDSFKIVVFSLIVFDVCNLFFFPTHWMVYFLQTVIMALYFVYHKQSSWKSK